MTNEGSTKNCKFHDPRGRGSCVGCGHISDIFLKKSSSLPKRHRSDKVIYSNDNQGRVYEIVNFMTHGAGVLVLGRGHISHMVKMHYF